MFFRNPNCGKIKIFVQKSYKKLGSVLLKTFQLTVLVSKLDFRDLKLKIDWEYLNLIYKSWNIIKKLKIQAQFKVRFPQQSNKMTQMKNFRLWKVDHKMVSYHRVESMIIWVIYIIIQLDRSLDPQMPNYIESIHDQN